MASPIEVQLILCDAAVSDPNGKVHMLGAGWSFTGTPTAPHAVAVLLGIPWDRTNQKIPFELELCDEDGQPVVLATGDGTQNLRHAGNMEIGRPPGVDPGTTLDASFTLSIPPLPLTAGRYQWRLSIGGQVEVKSFAARSQGPPG
ncbi:DUF6941 family protein [Nocardiopsis baichengensis]|uniref:DUF6941 family protein n=1 Tax=Nocardiopsis baichengensis TaxID=280240 RepID=UPI0003770CDD|nr:hypothetical protein [Nocardiopsis baichengensis]